MATASVAEGYHLSGHDSVIGSAGHYRIPWSSATIYDTAKSHARNTWNDLGDVDIHYIEDGETATLRWVDYYDEGDSHAAWYDWHSSSLDYIRMNQRWLGPAGDSGSGYNLDQEKAVAAHEVGHALGLAHNNDYTQLMDPDPAAYDGSFHIVPQREDRADYYYLWGAWAYDVSDDRLLVGGATDVFVGTVEEQVDDVPVNIVSESPEYIPTRFAWSVTTESTVKGDPGREIVVVQQAGKDEEGDLMLFEGDSLLEPGGTYLFVTHKTSGGYLLTAPGFDHFRVTGDASLQALTDRFEAAEASQIDPWSVING